MSTATSDFVLDRARDTRALARLLDMVGLTALSRRVRWLSRRLVDLALDLGEVRP